MNELLELISCNYTNVYIMNGFIWGFTLGGELWLRLQACWLPPQRSVKKRPNYKLMTDFRSAPSSVDTNIKATHAAGGALRFDFKM